MMSLSANEVDFGEQNVIYITEQAASEWTLDATRELIRLYDEKTDLLEKGILKTRKILFENIASEMVKKSYYYNPQQCENKWKSLKRSYLTRLERNPSIIKTKPKPFESEVAEIVKRERATSRKTLHYSEAFDDDLGRPAKIAKQEVMSEEAEDGNEDTGTVEQSFLDNSVSSGQKHQFDLIGEVRELKHIMKDIHQSVSRHVLQTLHVREQKLELKRTKIEKQGEIIQQMKIQNSLMAKIVQKLGS